MIKMILNVIKCALLLTLSSAFVVPSKRELPRILHNNLPKFSFEGPKQVDMNMYNIPLEKMEEQWVATVVPKTLDDDGGVFLSSRDQREYFVDSVVVKVKRPVNQSLGIMLQELAGGREDGLGITVVSGLVEGGYISKLNEDIQIGDSVAQVCLLRDAPKNEGGIGLQTQQEEYIVTTECLGYDATLDAIRNLPEPISNDEFLVLTLKRLRRKPKVKVNLIYPPDQKEKDCTIELFAGENLRMGLLSRSVSLNDTLAKRFDGKEIGGNCGGSGGLCRTCAVSILRGGELLSPIKVAERQMLQDNPRWRLACRAYVGNGMKEGEISIQVFPRQLA